MGRGRLEDIFNITGAGGGGGGGGGVDIRLKGFPMSCTSTFTIGPSVG